MKIFALLNDNGMPKAFYTSDIHKEIPEECVEISKDQHEKLCQGGKALVEGEVVDFVIELTEEESALEEIKRLEAIITPRAIRESKRSGSAVKGYLNGELYCEDVEAEIERIETEVLGR